MFRPHKRVFQYQKYETNQWTILYLLHTFCNWIRPFWGQWSCVIEHASKIYHMKQIQMASSSNLVFHVFIGLLLLLIVLQISTSECSQDWLRQLLVAPTKSSPLLVPHYAPSSEFLHLRKCKSNGFGSCCYYRASSEVRTPFCYNLEVWRRILVVLPLLLLRLNWRRTNFWTWSMWTHGTSFGTSITLHPLHILGWGDFNIDMSNLNKPLSQIFHHFLTSHSLTQPISSPTKYGTSSATILDLFLTTPDIPITSSSVLHRSFSNHLPICL